MLIKLRVHDHTCNRFSWAVRINFIPGHSLFSDCNYVVLLCTYTVVHCILLSVTHVHVLVACCLGCGRSMYMYVYVYSSQSHLESAICVHILSRQLVHCRYIVTFDYHVVAFAGSSRWALRWRTSRWAVSGRTLTFSLSLFLVPLTTLMLTIQASPSELSG